MQSVKIINGRDAAFTISTNARTLGELIDALRGDSRTQDVDFDRTQVLMRDSTGRHNLSYGEENLSSDPEYKVFLVAKEMKFGVETRKVGDREVSIASLMDVRDKVVLWIDGIIANDPKIMENIDQQVVETVLKIEKPSKGDLEEMESF